MNPIYTSITTSAKASIEEDLKHRATMIEAGAAVANSAALQYALEYMYHTQAEKLLNLAVTNSDASKGAEFLLAHANVQARLESFKLIWDLGYEKEELIADYQDAVIRNQEGQSEE